jgi:hypothetical protein
MEDAEQFVRSWCAQHKDELPTDTAGDVAAPVIAALTEDVAAVGGDERQARMAMVRRCRGNGWLHQAARRFDPAIKAFREHWKTFMGESKSLAGPCDEDCY